MKLGICVIDDRYGATVVALLERARHRHWSVRCFLTDRGTLLLHDPAFVAQLRDPALHFSVCELSIERHFGAGLAAQDFAGHLVVGGQYQNAELMHNCDQILVF